MLGGRNPPIKIATSHSVQRAAEHLSAVSGNNTPKCEGLSCLPCTEVECEPISPSECAWGETEESCGCCKECARGPGEKCGGAWFLLGRCGTNLECHQTREQQRTLKGGICVNSS